MGRCERVTCARILARPNDHPQPAFVLLELLDRINVAAAIRARLDALYVVVQDGSSVTLEEGR